MKCFFPLSSKCKVTWFLFISLFIFAIVDFLPHKNLPFKIASKKQLKMPTLTSLLWKSSTFTGWPADLKFLETWKNQGILMWNCEKSENFTCVKQISSKFFQNSFKWWTRINHACSFIVHAHGFLSKNKYEF